MVEDVDKIIPPSRSDINIDKGLYSGDLGLSDNYAIVQPYVDFILAEYIDVCDESMLQSSEGLYIPQSTKNLHWRKGKVLQVGTHVQYTQPGDIIVFPNDKGLPASKITYFAADGTTQTSNNAIFLNEYRIFAKVQEVKR